jgi:hypothetical protein
MCHIGIIHFFLIEFSSVALPIRFCIMYVNLLESILVIPDNGPVKLRSIFQMNDRKESET